MSMGTRNVPAKAGVGKNWESLWYSLLAIGVSFVLVAFIMLTMGYNPLNAYMALFRGSFGSLYAVSLTLCRSVPLIFVGLAVGFALKGGMFNIGGEGSCTSVVSPVQWLLWRSGTRYHWYFPSLWQYWQEWLLAWHGVVPLV